MAPTGSVCTTERLLVHPPPPGQTLTWLVQHRWGRGGGGGRREGGRAYLVHVEVEKDASGHLGDEDQEEEGKVLGTQSGQSQVGVPHQVPLTSEAPPTPSLRGQQWRAYSPAPAGSGPHSQCPRSPGNP